MPYVDETQTSNPNDLEGSAENGAYWKVDLMRLESAPLRGLRDALLPRLLPGDLALS